MALSQLRTFCTAKTPTEKAHAQNACLILGKLILNSIQPMLENPRWLEACQSASEEFEALSKTLLQTAQPWSEAALQAEYCGPDNLQTLVDQVENLSQQVFNLTELVKEQAKIIHLRRVA